MNDKFPEFANFIGAYFNQDWDLDGDTDEAIVEFFKGQEPAEIVCKVIMEMELINLMFCKLTN